MGQERRPIRITRAVGRRGYHVLVPYGTGHHGSHVLIHSKREATAAAARAQSAIAKNYGYISEIKDEAR